MKFTIENVSKYHCSGCSACANLCPVNAISMQENEEGFLFPHIDHEKCTSCGLCYNKCPSVNFDKFESESPTVYGMMANNSMRMTSSSGGMFSVLSKYVFDQKGVVCGVANTDTFKLEFVFATNMEELEPIKGSKYYQAEVGNTYQRIKDYLREGTLVLFCGCPCQVAGLKNHLGSTNKNLITADVVCHGIPSYKAVKAYAETLTSPENISEKSFIFYQTKPLRT